MEDIAKLLTIAAELDPRVTVSVAKVEAWHSILSDLTAADAWEAVRAHYRSSTEVLMPAHVVDGVREILRERFWDGPQLVPEEHRLCVAAGVSPEEYEDRRGDEGFEEWVAHLRARTGLAVES